MRLVFICDNDTQSLHVVNKFLASFYVSNRLIFKITSPINRKIPF